MFENIIVSPIDSIFNIEDLFHTDNRLKKINLNIGVYKNKINKTPVLTSVKKAEQFLLENENTKSYLSIEGIHDFSRCIQKLTFGENSAIIRDNRACTAQTPGGTCALRIAADFLIKNMLVKSIWISNPSWPNHRSIFNSSGFKVYEYTYYDPFKNVLDFDSLMTSLNKAQAGDAVLFHGCCHNPTGIDPTLDQWIDLAKISIKKKLLPIFDCAYQGFAHGLEEDTKGLRIFAALHQELIVVNSCSKNFSLYNERVGACTLIAEDEKITNRAFKQMKSIIRTNYSNPPAHGASIVTIILNNNTLRAIWEQELKDMRKRIQQMRKLFVSTLSEKCTNRDFSFVLKQNGMFSCIGLTKKQITRLRKEFGIYTEASGRINITGMTEKNMTPICKAISSVLQYNAT